MNTQLELTDSSGPIVVHQPKTPMELVYQLASSNADLAVVEKAMELAERFERNDAAQKFAAALSRFQAECPAITKDRTAEIRSDKGNYKYQFASYDDVMRQVKPVLERCGIGVSFSTTKSDTGILVTCRIRHGIHSEDHTLDVPVPAMKVNDTQRFGAALSYAKRYALCAALNIVVTDEDDDAQGQIETITEEQSATIREWLVATATEEKRFLAWAGVKAIKDVPAAKFPDAIAMFRRKGGMQ